MLSRHAVARAAASGEICGKYSNFLKFGRELSPPPP